MTLLKKDKWQRNGSAKVTVKTLHGSFEFQHQRLRDRTGSEARIELDTSIQDSVHMSAALTDLCALYSTKFNFHDVVDVIARITGQRLVSAQTVWKVAQAKAARISDALEQNVQETCAPMPAVAEHVDVYSDEPEINMLVDAILVARQKSKRGRGSDEKASCNIVQPPLQETISKARPSGRVSTDIAMIEKHDGQYEYLTAGIDASGKETVSLVDQVRSFICREHTSELALPLVAITDGATAIRYLLEAIFGHMVTLVMDWFHLCKRIREKMTMIARNKAEKLEHLKQIVVLLWRGKTAQAIEYLQNQVVARNAQVRDELIQYLTKHANEIIDYERRRNAGKTIGSGRIEKGVDLVVGHRQKRKAMSWTDKGSKHLAILETALLNKQWIPALPSVCQATG